MQSNQDSAPIALAKNVPWSMLAVYGATFHLWLIWSGPLQWGATVVSALILSLLIWQRHKSGGFINRWDLGFHLSIVLDILLEGFWINWHDGFTFYGCAAGFGLVIGYYRLSQQSPHKGGVLRS